MNTRRRRAGLPTTGARPRPANLLDAIEGLPPAPKKPRAARVNPADYDPASLEHAIRTFHLAEFRRARLARLDDYRADLAAAMPEDKGRESVQSHLLKLVKTYRLPYAYHTHRSDMSEAGFTDWVLVGDAGMGATFAELKRESGVFSAAQIDCMLALEAAGERVTYFSPVDVFTGRMEAEIAKISKRGRRL